MSVTDIKNAFRQVTQDQKIDVRDVDTILTEAGAISADEERAIVEQARSFDGMMESDARSKLREKLNSVKSLRQEAARANRSIQAQQTQNTADVKRRLTVGRATTTFGGTAIPDSVKQAVNQMTRGGAVAYDVRELKPDPVYDTEHGEPEIILDGKYNPYSQESRAMDSLAFDYTELTPQSIERDMNTVQSFKMLKGYTGQGNGQVAEFEQVSMKGNGRITELYDEAHWPETKARANGGQKYASNFAILADGSVHAVPASRRYAGQPNLILTTASLARGKQMLFNGHLHMENGVVTYVGMSGRLCKLQAKGTKFVDPIEILKAWGFKMSPGLKVTNEG